MNPKSIVTTALLVFVGVSVAYLVFSGGKQENFSAEQSSQEVKDVSPTEDGGVEVDLQGGEPSHKVIAYYFHGTRRCSTCRTIEAYTEEALKEGFSEELNAGALEWQPINVALSENEHFIRDYELTTRSVVLSDMWKGQQKRWKNLPKVWELVRDKSAFVSYIQEETGNFLEEQNE